ncbi:MAG: PfkB family carbohydrate kinase [Acidimicrobiia bacterium]|nr:PfkB family carbohydrate kinase [Acidimicrobiia bacterium]
MTRLICGGLTTFDLAYFVPQLPARGRKGTATRSYVDAGGPVGNAAITASILGSDAEVHSVFGDGHFAARVKEILAGYEVACADHGEGIDLPVASVWIDESGERTILSTDNKRSQVRAQHELIDISGARAVLLDGHYPQLQVALADAASAAGVPIVLDCGRWRPVFADLLPVATALIMTATFRPPDLEAASVGEAVGAIRERYEPELCAVSRGSDPILVSTADGLIEVPVPVVDVVDTTGAGDVLHGAYLHYRYTEKLDPMEALGRSALVASASCRGLGARGLTDSE